MTRTEESDFQDFLAGELRKYGWSVRTEVMDRTGKRRLDLIAYHKLIDCWIGIELKVPESLADYTNCLVQLIEYRKSDFFPSPLLLSLLYFSDNIEWFHHRYFWRFGFGVGHYSPSQPSWMPVTIAFPPNGNTDSTLNLQDLEWKNYSRSWEGLDPKKQVENIFSTCIQRWRVFGYECTR